MEADEMLNEAVNGRSTEGGSPTGFSPDPDRPAVSRSRPHRLKPGRLRTPRLRPLRPRLRPAHHQLALAAILLALIPLAGFNAVWSADEGALLYQISSLTDGRGWTFGHPFPAADPDGTYFPIHLSSWAPGGGPDAAGPGLSCGSLVDGCRYIVLGKHTGFLWLSAGLFQLGGYGAIIAFSVAGTVAAATATSRLAGLYEPTAAVPALWITGLASPLFVSSYVAWAHTAAAALVGWAAYGLLTETRRSTWRPAGLVLLFLACVFRTEAPLAGLALGLGLAVAAAFGSVDRARRSDRLRTGGAAIVASVAGLSVDRATAVATDGPVQPLGFEEAFGFLAGRIDAFTITWLQPAYGSDRRDLLLLIAAALTLVAGVVARRGRVGSSKAMALLSLALVAVLARFAVASAALIPGLVVAFPVLFVGLVLLDRRAIIGDRLVELLAPFALFCGAVLATQYRQGGGGEWGGRYFMVGLPMGIAAASAGLVRAGAALPPGQRRRLAGLLMASMALLSTMGLLGLRAVRHQTAALATDIALAIDGQDRSEQPVVVTTIDGLGRWMWRDVDRGRWLRVPREDLADVGARLHDLGVEQLVLVSGDRQQELGMLSGWYEPEASSPSSRSGSTAGVSVIVLHIGP